MKTIFKASLVKTFAIAFVLALAILGKGPSALTAREQPKASLYERLGGVYPIAAVVDTFIEILYVNDVLNANPAINEARDRVGKAGLKYNVTALVCEVTGGPCKYTGRTMKESHGHLNITKKEWEAMMTDFVRVLNNYGVPELEQKELIAIMEETRPDIVNQSESKR